VVASAIVSIGTLWLTWLREKRAAKSEDLDRLDRKMQGEKASNDKVLADLTRRMEACESAREGLLLELIRAGLTPKA
jgi:hypothetical protein